MKTLFLAPLMLVSCVPDWGQADPAVGDQDLTEDTSGSGSETPDDDADAPADTGGAAEEDGDGTDGGDGDGDDDSGPGNLGLVDSGLWAVDSVSLLDDPCDWLPQIPNFFSTTAAADNFEIGQLLPRTFDVVGDEQRFQIEARNYNARRPVDCEFDGAAFTCGTQTIATRDSTFYGFTYFIDYSGSVVDSEYVEGSATVRYEVDDWWTDFLDNYDVSVSECTQVYGLNLRRR